MIKYKNETFYRTRTENDCRHRYCAVSSSVILLFYKVSNNFCVVLYGTAKAIFGDVEETDSLVRLMP